MLQFWLTYFAYLCLLFMFWTDHTTIRASFCACIRIEIHSKCIVARNVKVFICMIFDENSNFYKLYFNVKYECRHCLTKANLWSKNTFCDKNFSEKISSNNCVTNEGFFLISFSPNDYTANVSWSTNNLLAEKRSNQWAKDLTVVLVLAFRFKQIGMDVIASLVLKIQPCPSNC